MYIDLITSIMAWTSIVSGIVLYIFWKEILLIMIIMINTVAAHNDK